MKNVIDSCISVQVSVSQLFCINGTFFNYRIFSRSFEKLKYLKNTIQASNDYHAVRSPQSLKSTQICVD